MKNQTILITGATSGIGELLARTLATKENTLILTGRNKKKLNYLKKELSPLCKKLVTSPIDLSKPDDLNLFALVYANKVSIVINSAADFGNVKNFLDVSRKEINEVFQVNVLAPIALTQSVLPFMIENNYGRIINIGSTGGLGGYPLRTPYCLSKNALVAFTKTLNGEIRSGEYGKISNVRAFCICPGPFYGERLNKQISGRAKYKNVPIGEAWKSWESKFRILEPSEVVDKILSLINSEDGLETDDVVTFK